MYQSRKSIAAPCDSNVVVSGTLRRIWGSAAPEIRMKRGGSPEDRRLARAITRPHANTETGANNGPTEAMPSVENSDALKLPSS